MTGMTPPSAKPAAWARASAMMLLDPVGIGAAADDLMRAGLRHVEHGHAIGGDAGGDQVLRHQAAHVARAAQCRERVPCIGLAIGARGRILPPGIAGRAQALHAAALLVDEDGRVPAADGGAEIIGQALQLFRRLAIAPEQDEAEGIGAREKGALGGAQRRAEAAGNEGADGICHEVCKLARLSGRARCSRSRPR